MALFMAGVGWGSATLGKRADRSASPLRLYGRLELCIAIAAALSPLLLGGVRAAYLAFGGSGTLGAMGATVARLALGALVLGLPTFLMGGTLPAAIAALQTEGRRKSVAVCYGANAAGAVIGVMLATFWLLEILGNRSTLWSACGLNILVAWGALTLAKREDALTPSAAADPTSSFPNQPLKGEAIPASALYAAAAFGVWFFLMELVWYGCWHRS